MCLPRARTKVRPYVYTTQLNKIGIRVLGA